MKITIFNQKGGVGNTMLAAQIALYFDLKIDLSTRVHQKTV